MTGKQLHHIIRLNQFLERYLNGEDIEECYIAKDKEYLINIKQNLDRNGKVLNLDSALELSKLYVKDTINMSDTFCNEINEYNSFGAGLLELAKTEIIKNFFKKILKST